MPYTYGGLTFQRATYRGTAKKPVYSIPDIPLKELDTADGKVHIPYKYYRTNNPIISWETVLFLNRGTELHLILGIPYPAVYKLTCKQDYEFQENDIIKHGLVPIFQYVGMTDSASFDAFQSDFPKAMLVKNDGSFIENKIYDDYPSAYLPTFTSENEVEFKYFSVEKVI